MSNQVQFTLVLVDKLTAVAKRAQSTMGNFARSAKTQVNSVSQSVKKLGNELNAVNQKLDKMSSNMGAGSALLGGVGIGLVANKMMELGMETELTKKSFDTLTGSAEKGKALYDQVKAYGDASVYSTQSVAQGAKTMMAYGVEAQKIMPTLKQIGDIAMGNSERFESMSLVMGQVQATGRLMGQDLLQFVNNGFNPLQQISQDTGISMVRLKKAMEQGAISAQMVEEAFKSATSAGGRFYKGADDASNTIAGKFQIMKSSMENAFIGLYNKLSPILSKIFNQLNKVFTFLQENSEIVIAALAGIASGLGAIVAMQIAVALTNPFTLIIIGIMAVVAALTYLYFKFDGIRRIMDALFVLFKNMGLLIMHLIVDPLIMAFTVVKTLITSMKKLFEGDFKGAMSDIKAGSKDVYGVIKKQADLIINTPKQMVDAYKKDKEAPKKGEESLLEKYKANYGLNLDETIGGVGKGIKGSKLEASSAISSNRNITINIGSMIENLDIESTDLSKSADQIVNILTDRFKKLATNITV